MSTLSESLDRMLHEHLRGIEEREKKQRIPHSTPPITLSHGNMPVEHEPCTRKPNRKCDVVSQSNKPVFLTEPEIIQSYNANRILGEGDNPYIAQRSITWDELKARRYERHKRY